MFLWLCLNLFYVFVFLCKPTLAFSLNPSKRTDINNRMCSPIQFIYNVFHFSHASSLFSYYFSKFRPNYKLVGCPMFMMGLASTSLLSEGSRRSFGMFCCLSVWGQIHERQTARGCVRYFCLVYFFCICICICKPLLRWRQINERRPDRACICPVEDDISSRPREDNKAFDRCICICFI